MKNIFCKVLAFSVLLFAVMQLSVVSAQVLCPVPQGLNATAITANSATLNWVSTNVGAYQLSYCPPGIANWTSVSTTTNSATISGLQPSTTYAYCVRSVCGTSGNTTITGNWSVIAYFTTQATAPVCQASFTFTSTATSPTTFQFTSTSTGVTSATTYLWNFGDNTTSTLPNPVHGYNLGGTYNVCLTITTPGINGTVSCVNTACQSITVIAAAACHASFVFVNTSATGGTVQFTSTSTGINPATTYLWNFGDNTTSTVQNPLHVFSQTGAYTVCLTITTPTNNGTPPCTHTTCLPVAVQLPTACQASFTFAPSPLANPTSLYSYQFTSTSTGINTATTYLWDFGDNSSSTLQNPVHNYAQPGTYAVCLTITTPSTSGTVLCTSNSCMALTTVQPPACAAGFTFSPTTNPNSGGYCYQFSNTSTGINNLTTYFWDFGDSTTATVASPLHSFAQAGTYNVCLTITTVNAAGMACTNTICHTVVIQAPAGCNTPAGLMATTITNHMAALNWGGANAMAYTVRYHSPNTLAWQSLTTLTTSATLANLLASTTYEVQVNSVCVGINGTSTVSPWSPSIFFTTMASPSPFVAKDMLNYYYDSPTPAGGELEMFDVTGMKICLMSHQFTPGNNEIRLDCPSLRDGMYILRVNVGGQMTSNKVLYIR